MGNQSHTAENIGDLLVQIHRKMINDISQYLSRYQVSFPQAIILKRLSQCESSTMGELASYIFLSTSAVTNLVDKLVKKSLVVRERNDHDRRVVSVKLTVKGSKLVKNINEKRNKRLEDLLRRLDPAECKQLVTIMSKMARLAVCIISLVTILSVCPAQCKPVDQLPASETDREKQLQPLSLPDCVNIAIRNNRAISKASEEIDFAEGQITSSRSAALPKLSIGAEYTHAFELPTVVFNDTSVTLGSPHNYDGSIILDQLLYSGGRVGAGLRVAHIYRQQAEENLRATRSDIIFAVTEAFHNALLAEELAKVTQTTREQAESHLETTLLLQKAGKVSDYDVLSARVRVANLTPPLIRAQNQARIAKDILKNLLAMKLEREIELQGTLHCKLQTFDFAHCLEQAYANRPELRQLELIESMQKERILAEKAGKKPDLHLLAEGHYNAQGDRFDPTEDIETLSWNTTLTFKLPLFDGLETSGKVIQAQAEWKKAKLQREQLQQDIALEVRASLHKLNESREVILSQSKTVHQAEENLKITRIRYRNQVGTHLEQIDAETALAQAKTNLLQAKHDYLVSLAALKKAIGVLEPEEHGEEKR